MGRRAACLLIGLLLIAGAARAEIVTTRPAPGITFERCVQADPPVHFFVVSVDLTNPKIHVKVSAGGSDLNLTPPWETTLMPVSEMAKRDGLFAAVNGNFFAPKDSVMMMGRKVPYFPGNWSRTCGWAMSDGRLFSARPLAPEYPSLVVDDHGGVTIGRFARVPEDARQVVSGITQIVTNGRNTAASDDDASTTFSKPAARTVVGLDPDDKTLVLFVVDGKRPDYSIGLTHHAIAEELIHRGVWNAIVMDGGGSTTLVMRDSQGQPQVVNRPTDGHDFAVDLAIERSVADALGVVVDGPTTRP
jgi:exopolysaccharide biosynthesis protein